MRNSSSLVSFVRNKIVDLILSNELKPGSKIPNEFQLAEQFNVSRSTVREAIKTLVAQHILEIQRGKGTYVKESLGLSDDPLGFKFRSDKYKLMIDCMELRLVLEPEIARMSARKATKQDIEAIKHWKEVVEHEVASNLDHSYSDIEFHTAIAISTHNDVISNVIPIITTSIPLFVKITESNLSDSTLHYHEEILQAIINQDEDRAFIMMKEHIQENSDFIKCMNNSIR